jgi:hypothetical protein
MKLLLNPDPNAAGGGTAAPTTPEWAASFPDDLKAMVTAKKWTDPAAALNSYRNLEKVQGDMFPKPDWDDTKYNDFYKRAGRPEAPDKYELKDAQELIKKSPVPIDDARLNKWKGEFHKHGFTERQANAILKTYLEDEFSGVQRHEQEQKNLREQAEMRLRGEWGNKYDENLKAAQAAFKRVAPEYDKVLNEKGLGNDPDVIKFFHTIASRISEDKAGTPPGGALGFGAGTPDAAKQEIQKLKDDKVFMEAFGRGDKSALEKWRSLHQAAFATQK